MLLARSVRCMATAVTSAAIRARMARIGTHSGSFHCDEALGCVAGAAQGLLRLFTGLYPPALPRRRIPGNGPPPICSCHLLQQTEVRRTFTLAVPT